MDGQVIVVSGGHFMGIITPRDIIERIVAKGLNPSETVVSAVMTPRSDTLSAGKKVVDALTEVRTIAGEVSQVCGCVRVGLCAPDFLKINKNMIFLIPKSRLSVYIRIRECN